MKRIKSLLGRDKKPITLGFFNHWIPTKESGEKIALIQIESSLNRSYPELNDRTPFEDTIINGNASNFFRIFPHLTKAETFKYYKRMLPLNKDEFIYKSVYSKTGGILNIFNPKVKEAMDDELKRLLNKYEGDKQAINIWKNTPSELWSGFPPKLVWVGSGDIEGQLLMDFLKKLTARFEGNRFDSEGECLISSIKFLREWQFRPNEVCFGEAPINAIFNERLKIYERKISFLCEMQIETDFV